MKEYNLGRFAGLVITITPAWLIGTLGLVAFLWAIGITVLGFSFPEAIAFGLLCTALHWMADALHQLGHAHAARQTGRPMTGVRFGTLGVLSTAIYPRDEPPLPASIHIHRALGGPKWSAAVTVISALIAAALWNTAALLHWASVFLFLDSLLVLTIGALLPLGFTDGSTILKWRSRV